MEECEAKKMEYMSICFCKRCKALDYAGKTCPRCGSSDITEASSDFLLFGNMAVSSKSVIDIGYDSIKQAEKQILHKVFR